MNEWMNAQVNHTLTSLELQHNEVGAEGIAWICTALKVRAM